MSWRVGILGAGPGAAALHVPTLARLSDLFNVIHIADAGSGRARDVARQGGIRCSTGDAELFADSAVEVVAVCSPPSEHARQILAAITAGKRAIFCEKPLATTRTDAEEVIEACRESGTVLLVGTNHLFDSAWGRVTRHLLDERRHVQSINVTVGLPPNDRYHSVVAEGGPFLARNRPRPDLTVPAVAAAVIRELLIGLAVHDLPALRTLAPSFEGVDYASLVSPVGYAVGYRASGIPVQLAAVMHPDGADALWRISITTTHDRIEVDFPPAFVHSGSGSVRVRQSDGRWTEYARDSRDGYELEWRAFSALLNEGLPVEYDDLLADAHYAIDIADAAAALILRGAQS